MAIGYSWQTLLACDDDALYWCTDNIDQRYTKYMSQLVWSSARAWTRIVSQMFTFLQAMKTHFWAIQMLSLDTIITIIIIFGVLLSYNTTIGIIATKLDLTIGLKVVSGRNGYGMLRTTCALLRYDYMYNYISWAIVCVRVCVCA